MSTKFSLACTFIGAVAAIVAAIASVQSVGLMSEQNERIQEQNDKISQQINLQASQNRQQQDDSLAARRLQALNALYEPTDASASGITPRADRRTRSEAVRYFVQLERIRLNGAPCTDPANQSNDCIVLSSSLLQDTDLRGIDFSRVILADAKLSRAQLFRANLSQSYMRGADLSSAGLEGVNFKNSDLQAVNMTGADLKSADLECSKLYKVDLQNIKNERSANHENALFIEIQHAPAGFLDFVSSRASSNEADWTQRCRAGATQTRS